MKNGLKNEMRGGFCEFEDNGNTRFIEVYTYKYSEKEEKYLRSINSLEDSNLHTFLKLFIVELPSNVHYLYKLQTYIGTPNTDDLWEFNEQIECYEEIGFYNIEDLLVYCKERWRIEIDDFKPLEETNIPN